MSIETRPVSRRRGGGPASSCSSAWLRRPARAAPLPGASAQRQSTRFVERIRAFLRRRRATTFDGRRARSRPWTPFQRAVFRDSPRECRTARSSPTASSPRSPAARARSARRAPSARTTASPLRALPPRRRRRRSRLVRLARGRVQAPAAGARGCRSLRTSAPSWRDRSAARLRPARRALGAVPLRGQRPPARPRRGLAPPRPRQRRGRAAGLQPAALVRRRAPRSGPTASGRSVRRRATSSTWTGRRGAAVAARGGRRVASARAARAAAEARASAGAVAGPRTSAARSSAAGSVSGRARRTSRSGASRAGAEFLAELAPRRSLRVVDRGAATRSHTRRAPTPSKRCSPQQAPSDAAARLRSARSSAPPARAPTASQTPTTPNLVRTSRAAHVQLELSAASRKRACLGELPRSARDRRTQTAPPLALAPRVGREMRPGSNEVVSSAKTPNRDPPVPAVAGAGR